MDRRKLFLKKEHFDYFEDVVGTTFFAFIFVILISLAICVTMHILSPIEDREY